MKVYIDLLFLLNVWIDFCLLILVKLILRRITKLKKIIIASLIGGLTTFAVFLNDTYIIITLIKILLSISGLIFRKLAISFFISNLLLDIISFLFICVKRHAQFIKSKLLLLAQAIMALSFTKYNCFFRSYV